MNRPTLRVLLLLMLLSSALAGAASPVAPAAAATLVVSTCNAASLATAINNAAAGDTITFSCSGTIALNTIRSHRYDIDKDLTIDGTGQSVTLDAGLTASMFLMTGDSTFTLRGLTFSQGLGQSGTYCTGCQTVHFGGVVTNQVGTLNIIDSTFSHNLGGSTVGGGAILNLFGNLNVSNSTFNNNTAYDEGGAIQSLGTLNVTNSTFTENLTRGHGGAISIEAGTATISGSTFNGNVANAFANKGSGGAVQTNGTTTIVNSTFHGNSAEAGGAIANSATLTLIHSTLRGNTAVYWGNGVMTGTKAGSILVGGGTTTFISTILANADVPSRGNDGVFNRGANCSGPGTFSAQGSNAADDFSCLPAAVPVTTTLLALGALADNGGPTQTIALGTGSIAINAATCRASATTDQRGFSRPATGLTTCDLGAYEVGAANPIQTTTLNGVSGAGVSQGTAVLSATLAVGGTGVAGKSVAFTLNGAGVGSATTGGDGIATLAGVSLTGIAAGAYPGAIGASFAGDAGYSASSGSGTLSVSPPPKVDQAISFDLSGLPAKVYGDSAFDISGYASATSGLPASFNSASPLVCSVSGSMVTILAAGPCSISADQAGNDGYNPAPQVQQQFSIGQATATITLDAATLSQTYTGSPRVVSATTIPPGLSYSVTYDSNTTPPTNAGSYAVVATITDLNYSGSATGALAVGKADQTISAVPPAPASAAYGASFSVAATAGSGLPVSYATSGVCSLSGATVTMTSGSGVCTVTFTQAGNSNFNAAPPVEQVVTAGKAEQSISFTSSAPANAVYGATYVPAATGGGSGNPVTFGASGACSYDSGSGVVTMSGTGSCTVTADQAGSANYAAALPATQIFAVARASLSVDANDATMLYGGPLPTLDAVVDGLVNGDTFAGLGGSCGAAVGDSPVDASPPAGSYPGAITCAGVDATNYDVTYTAGTLTVNRAPQITSANGIAFEVGVAGTFSMTAVGHPAATFSVAEMLPAGLTLTAQGLLSGTPDDGTGGSYSLTITASNGIDPDAVQAFTLTVNEGPVMTSATTTTFVVGIAGSFNVTADGYPAATFSVAEALPAGLSLSATGLLSGTPQDNTGGVYQLTITASNGVDPDAVQSFTLTINEAPEITSANGVTFDVGDPNSSFLMTASGYPAPTFSVSGTLPAGITLSPAGLLGGTTAIDGTFVVTITASNGINPNATQTFTLATVPPVIFAPDDIVVANDAGVNGAVVSYPPPLTEGYVGIVTCIPVTGTLFPLGTTTVTCVSSTSSATASFTVTVNDTEPPVIVAPEDMVVFAAGPNGANVSYPAPTVSDNAPGVTWGCVPPTGSLFPIGITTVTCTATDAAGNTASDTFTIRVRSSVQACLFAGSLSQASPLYGGETPTLSCGRGTAIVLSDGPDYRACSYAGTLSQFSSTTSSCSRGQVVTFSAGTDYHGCLYAGTLSQLGLNKPANCGRGMAIGLARATMP